MGAALIVTISRHRQIHVLELIVISTLNGILFGMLLFLMASGLVGLTLALIYLQTSAAAPEDSAQASEVLWKVFFALTIIIGVVAWLFVFGA